MNLLDRIAGVCGDSVCVPDSVWYCPQLTPTDVKLYKVLLDYAKLILNREDGKKTAEGYPVINVSQKTLAEKVAVSVKTIQGCIQRLLSVKLIRVDGNRGYKRNNHIILTDEFYGVPAEKQNAENQERRLQPVEQEIQRKAVKRKAIKFPRTLLYALKLQELGAVIYSEKAIIELARHYDMLASQFNHLSGYRSLAKKNPKDHKNWKHFEKLNRICMERGWDAKIYVEAQFDRARKYWKHSKFKFPLPSMLNSEKAVQYFERYLEDRKEKYAYDVNGKERLAARKTINMRQKLIRDVINSAELLKMYARDPESKALRIFHAWEAYSPAYLWSIPWFREYLKELAVVQPDHPKLEKYLAEMAMIDRSPALQEVVKKAVKMAEEAFGLPENLAI